MTGSHPPLAALGAQRTVEVCLAEPLPSRPHPEANEGPRLHKPSGNENGLLCLRSVTQDTHTARERRQRPLRGATTLHLRKKESSSPCDLWERMAPGGQPCPGHL